MKIISLVSSKGGVGKSTLSACLAAHAARLGETVFLADLDPQQSSAAWWRRRKGPENPMLVIGATTVTELVSRIRQKQAERGYMIVDTPGSLVPVIADAVEAADAVIVVVQASGKDIEAQGVTEGLITKMSKISRSLYVLNRCDRRSSLPFDAAAKLQSRSVFPPFMVGDRVEYIRADMAGKTAPEINSAAGKDANEEISALWQVIKGIADNGEKDSRSVRRIDGARGQSRSESGGGRQSRTDRRPPSEAERPQHSVDPENNRSQETAASKAGSADE